MKDASPPPSKSNVQTSIGKRQTGDRLLHFESKDVRNYSRFPSRAFSYNGSDRDEYLTYAKFSFSVSNSYCPWDTY